MKVDFNRSGVAGRSFRRKALIEGSRWNELSPSKSQQRGKMSGATADHAFRVAVQGLGPILFAALIANAAAAHAETCESLAHRIVAAEGGVIVSVRQLGFMAIKHPLTYAFSVSCDKVLTVTIGSEATPAPPAFFDLVGRVTALFTPLSQEVAKAAATRCINTAMVSTNTAEIYQGGIEFSCFPISEEGDVPKIDITPQK